MLQRHVYVKLTDDLADDAGRRATRRAVLQAAAEAGLGLLGAGLPADPGSARSWDLAFLVDLSGGEAAWTRIEAEVLAPRAACVKGWNFEVDAPVR